MNTRMDKEQRAAKKLEIETKINALLPVALQGRVKSEVVVLKSGMTKVITRSILKARAHGEQSGEESTA